MRIDHPAAREDYLEAVRYYAEHGDGLGDALIDCFEEAVDDVLDAPETWPLVQEWDEQPSVRSRKVHRFPYRVVYYQRSEEIIILAYAHQHRRPGYWRDRLGN
ncbi:MAG: type II toxin-antitoxin system RelE/ParE family toxin [Propionibacteriaceae bacterium]|jgi:plasmid stabilization system protein ParE|nr:type II toxin-antitoxin system RelE/ParE family toxin [Propionibacteriaceae bacterium]